LEVATLAEEPLGIVVLQPSVRLVFTISRWKGRLYAHVRKFVATGKYEGPTKAGLAMRGDVLVGVIDALQRLQAEVSAVQGKEFARISKRGEVDIVIATVAPDDLHSLPSVDVREYVDTPEYSGPTKKGIRFPWQKLPEVIVVMQTFAQELGAEHGQAPKLFPDKPQWVEQTEEVQESKSIQGDPVLNEVLPAGPKEFPRDFLSEGNVALTTVQLPIEPVEVAQQKDGKYLVRSSLGFLHPIRNAAEGNYIYYSYLRGDRVVKVPNEMIVVFRTVKAYENYLRDLRHALVQAYERKSGHRLMAEHRAKQVFRDFGLPWPSQS
jgi:hypothetical protein